MTEEPDVVTLILAPYRVWTDAESMVAGSRIMRADCGHLAWISPQGEPALQAGARTECLRCHAWADEQSYRVLPGVQEALDEAGVSIDVAAEVAKLNRRQHP